MPTATIDEFDLDIKVADLVSIQRYPDLTQQSGCWSRDVSCHDSCATSQLPCCA